MSVLDPEVPIPEEPEEQAIVVPAMPAPPQFVKAVCAACMRPLWPIQNPDGTWKHDDATIDMTIHPDYHQAELWIEPKVLWGFQNERKPFGAVA